MNQTNFYCQKRLEAELDYEVKLRNRNAAPDAQSKDYPPRSITLADPFLTSYPIAKIISLPGQVGPERLADCKCCVGRHVIDHLFK